MKDLTDRDIANALAVIAHRPSSDFQSGIDASTGITLPELQSFVSSVRKVASEFSSGMVNRIFYSATQRPQLTLDDAMNAIKHPEFGVDWQNIFQRAISKMNSRVRPCQAHTTLPPLAGSSPRSHGSSSPRSGSNRPRTMTKNHLKTVVQSALLTRSMTLGSQKQVSDFPPWAMHQGEEFADNFDSLRTNRNGVSLVEARKQDEETRTRNLQRIQPNENGAIVVPASPRNNFQAVVIVDATAEQEKMRKAMAKQAELKMLLALGGTSVEKYIHGLPLGDTVTSSASAAHDGVPKTPPTSNCSTKDLGYQRTLTAMVDYLASPRK